ncbi:MAG: hypothetical protein AB1446_02480 [Bacillota bacterium]
MRPGKAERAVRWMAGLVLALSSGMVLSLGVSPGYSPLAAGAWIPLLLGLHLVIPQPAPVPSALLPVLGWAIFLASEPASGYLTRGLELLAVWACVLGDAAFHRRTGWRFLALLGTLQVVGIEKVRLLLAHALGQPWGHATWVAASHAHPLCYPLARWMGPSCATLAVAFPQFLLVQALLRLTPVRAAPPTGTSPPGTPSAGTSPPGSPPAPYHRWKQVRRWTLPGLALLLAAAVLVPWLSPGLLPRSAPGGITVAVVQPGWTHHTHPLIWQALEAADAGRVTTVLLAEAERGARQARDQGAQLVLWPLDYLNFDPVTDRAGGDHLVRLARVTGAILVLPYGFWTPDGLARGVAVVYPKPRGDGQVRGQRLEPGRAFVFPIDGLQATFLPLVGGPFISSPAPRADSGWAVRQLASLVAGPRLAAPGSTLALTTAGAGFSPLDLVAHAASHGISLLHAGWGTGGGISPGYGGWSAAGGISLIADAPTWRTTLSPPGSRLLLARISPGPGPTWLFARADPLGWLGVISLILGAIMYRRRSAPQPPSNV